MNYVVWETAGQQGVCTLLEVENVEDEFELTAGTSRIAGWPDDALCRMDPSYKKDVALADCLHGATVIVISGKLKSALDRAEVNDVEMLPIAIVNHKGRVAAKDYFIVNPQDECDCIDLAASKVKMSNIDPDTINNCKGLVLREHDVPPGYKIFRLARWREVVVVRRDVADALQAAGFTGLWFVECARFRG